MQSIDPRVSKRTSLFRWTLSNIETFNVALASGATVAFGVVTGKNCSSVPPTQGQFAQRYS
jgi:hypothetical protein